MENKQGLPSGGGLDHISLTEFANRHEYSNEEFLNGHTSRSRHADGGNVVAEPTEPDWTMGAQNKKSGGNIEFEWAGGSDNYRVKRKDGGDVPAARKIKSFIESVSK